jgi:4-amino-4-deoxy-L-arabinose transferase-like glycosyltransferase
MRQSSQQYLWIILFIAAILRLLVVLPLDPMTSYTSGGGDSLWYLAYGQGLWGLQEFGTALGIPYTTTNIPTAPLYLYFTGGAQALFSDAAAIWFIWLIQIAASVSIIYLVYRISFLLFNESKVGLVAATALALSPAMILESSLILTETLYTFFITAGLWLYIEFVSVRATDTKWYMVALIGAVFGLATLTRAVSLLFPFGLAGHLLLLLGRKHWKRDLVLGFILLAAYSGIVSTWTIHNVIRSNRIIIGSNQFMPAVWRGATEDDGSPRQNDELLGEQTAAEQASEIISSDPMGYVQRRIDELLAAYLQPHGTISFGQQSLKAMALDWLQSGLSSEGFAKLLSGEGFWMKLIIYIWHYISLIGGFIGMWLTRRNWRISLVLIGFIIYTSLVHIITLALPRYIFPTYPIWWIFAAVSLVALWDMWQTKGVKFIEEGANPPTKS